jgi:triosephosphate isomerase
MRRLLIAGNWKMNGSLKSITTLTGNLRRNENKKLNIEIAVFPPAIYLAQVKQQLSDSTIYWGAQNLSAQENGAFTGEISATMLQDLNCRFTLIGHSERRTLYKETDLDIAAKFTAALACSIIPILCVGESLSEREQGITNAVVANQINTVLEQVSIKEFNNAVIAYEPIWAIGTGKTATAAQAQEVHAFIRKQLAMLDSSVADKIQIIYGGSVKGSNASELFNMPDIDGALVGGASLVAKDFLQIIAAAQPISERQFSTNPGDST